ncbi:hypothetical protein K505DRAFT_364443 [Melanomma pulvis-pyrius CBS 109.77]|uniref:Protein kinase domain-containing protein n=1 Tax=Melanomma pulvis-pyrius CBS 109.77 TaxID=1314802 RepID=A0A6A6X3S2_9PLEO|nr:hypothetical protein K505DRAFT_364443 [Melanomma pulvis-pyrius CBS 109.77]
MYAIEVIEDPVNSPEDCPRCVDATRQSPELQGRQSRETTAPPEDDYDEKVQPQDRDRAIHNLGVLHKDLEPCNILWNEETGRPTCSHVTYGRMGITVVLDY